MPVKKKTGEETMEVDAFKAGASGKFDEPLEARGKETLPAEPTERLESEKTELLDDDIDKKDEGRDVETEPETSSPLSPATEEFDFSPPKNESGGKKMLWVILIFVFLGIGIGAGILIFKNGVPGISQATPSPEPTLEATPTPAPELDRSKLNIQVQNGIGVAGTAKEAQEFLEELGYTVGGARNAATYDYEETEVSLKEDKMGYKDQLIKDLSSNYTLSEDVETLDEDSKFDAVVIIGGKLTGGGD